jgi:hypothetical protein
MTSQYSTPQYSTEWLAIKYLLEPDKVFKTLLLDLDLGDNTYLSVMQQNGAIGSRADPNLGRVLTIPELSRFIKKYVHHNIFADQVFKTNKFNSWYLFKLEDQKKYVLACSDTTTTNDIHPNFIVFGNSTNFFSALTNNQTTFEVQEVKQKKSGGRRKSTKKSMKKRSNKKNRTKYNRRKFMNY